ncbi:MAG: FBP domain-containing protein [Kineosporiaceae bacterium]
MHPVAEPEIRASFVNCSQGEAKRLPVPRELETLPWDDLDFLGWRDPRGSDRAYLVAPVGDGLVGITLRAATARIGFVRRSVCSLCLTTHTGSGVVLMTAPKAGTEGRQGASAGVYLCSDLACSLYLRGRRSPASGERMRETLTLEDQVARLHLNLEAFLRDLGVPS